MDLSKDQKLVLDKLLEWYGDSRKKHITLGGYAGTGKTTLISVFRKELDKKNKKIKVAFCSFTGKATRVLKSKLVESRAIFDDDNVSTIHSLIYSPIISDKQEITGWKRKEVLEFDLIIVDEASMVDEKIWDDLSRFQKPIIAVGDHGQLPPINGSFNLVENPILKLEEIHRQVKDNPIIKLSILAREEGKISPGNYGGGVKKILKREMESSDEVDDLLKNYKDDTLVLCGYNFTRIKLNKFIRNALENYSHEPVAGDRVICLRNNHEKEIYNGMLGTITEIHRKDDEWYMTKIEMDDLDDLYEGLILKSQFNNQSGMNYSTERYKTRKGDLFDFGYALTVHKAQGSQSKRVILFEERFSKMDDEMWKRWLYTAVTRAEEELFIIG